MELNQLVLVQNSLHRVNVLSLVCKWLATNQITNEEALAIQDQCDAQRIFEWIGED
jgi:hypothetical protein